MNLATMLRNPYKDVLAGVDLLIQEGISDPGSLGIYGSSYGGWLTAWSLSQTTRFKGAVAAVGLYDILHIDRSNGNAFYTFFKNRLGSADPNAMWNNPDLYKEISPIENISSIKTPMLLVETGGERLGQESMAKVLFNGLINFGVESYLVYYPKAFHNGGWNDEYKKDYMLRLLAWFDYCIKGEPLPDWFNSSE